MNEPFKALMVDKTDSDFIVNVKEVTVEDLPPGDVLINVRYSSVNYKDGLASTPDGKIVRSYPFIPGIDLSGVVVRSNDSRFKAGDEVIATSYEIGVSHYGGYSEYAQIPADWVLRLPKGLSLKEAMVYGTAGLTAGLSVQRLEENGLTPDKGKVLVTGATGGVGSIAVAILAKRGYHVVASTGKQSEHDFLFELGASEILSREDVTGQNIRALDRQLWAAAIDPVGGKTLASILTKITYNGSVAVSGLTGGGDVPTTVFPFILRGVSLLGIDSVYCPMEARIALWKRMATDFKPDHLLKVMNKQVPLDELPNELTSILKGEARGRTIVKL